MLGVVPRRQSRQGGRPRLLCYMDSEWALGRITHGMVRHLQDEFYVDCMDWAHQPLEVFASIANEYDVIYMLLGIAAEHAEALRGIGVPLEKIVAVAHTAREIEYKEGPSLLAEVGALAAISPDAQAAVQKYTHRPVRLVRVGLDLEAYERARIERPRVRTLGYGTVMNNGIYYNGVDNKRGHLATIVAERMGMSVIAPDFQKMYWNYRGMADFYRRVDVVLSTSTVEGGPYAPMEAAACGIPSVVTDCGVMKEFFAKGGGHVLPVAADQFVEGACLKIGDYLLHPEEFHGDQCRAFEAALRRSWDNVIGDWSSLFMSVARGARTPHLRGAWDSSMPGVTTGLREAAQVIDSR